MKRSRKMGIAGVVAGAVVMLVVIMSLQSVASAIAPRYPNRLMLGRGNRVMGDYVVRIRVDKTIDRKIDVHGDLNVSFEEDGVSGHFIFEGRNIGLFRYKQGNPEETMLTVPLLQGMTYDIGIHVDTPSTIRQFEFSSLHSVSIAPSTPPKDKLSELKRKIGELTVEEKAELYKWLAEQIEGKKQP
jgi:hypothetical protein